MSLINDKKIQIAEQGSNPSTPSAGNRAIFPKADGWYDLDDAGVATLLGGGSFTNFDVAADSGTPATIDDGETLTIAGGTGVTTSISGNTVTIDFNGLSLTSESVEVWKNLGNPTLGSNGSFDVDLSSGEALNCEHLHIKGLIRSTEVDATNFFDQIYLFFNNDQTVTNYYRQQLAGATSTALANLANVPLVATIPNASSDANAFTSIEIIINDFRNTTKEKIATAIYSTYSTTSITYAGIFVIHWNNTNAITRIQIETTTDPTTQIATGSELWVYGLKTVSVLTNVTVS